jgi:hypothetical protein
MEIGHVVMVIGDWVIRMPTWFIVLMFLFGGFSLVRIYWR